MTLFNQWWTEHDGSAIGNVPSPKLVVHTDTPGLTMNDGQQGFVRNAYAKFCTSVATSCFPKGYHRQEYSAADGTKVRMESINGTHKTQVWISGGAEKEESGWLYLHLGVAHDEVAMIGKSWVLRVSPDLKKAEIVYAGTPLVPPLPPRESQPWADVGGVGGTTPLTVVGKTTIVQQQLLTGAYSGYVRKTLTAPPVVSPTYTHTWTDGSRTVTNSASITRIITLDVQYTPFFRYRGAQLVAGDKIIHSIPTTMQETVSFSNAVSTITSSALIIPPGQNFWGAVQVMGHTGMTLAPSDRTHHSLGLFGAHEDYVFLEYVYTTPAPIHPFHPTPWAHQRWMSVDGVGPDSSPQTIPVTLAITSDGQSDFGTEWWHINKSFEKVPISEGDIISAADPWHNPDFMPRLPQPGESRHIAADRVRAAANALQRVSRDKTHVCWPAITDGAHQITVVGERYKKRGPHGAVRKTDMLAPTVLSEDAEWWSAWRAPQPLVGRPPRRRVRRMDVVGLKETYYAIVGYFENLLGIPAASARLYQSGYGSNAPLTQARLSDLLPTELQGDLNKLYVVEWTSTQHTTRYGGRSTFLLYRGPP